MAEPSTDDVKSQRFKRFDSFLEPGNTTTFPGSENSATQDLGGYRTWLADHEMALRAIVNFNVTYNPLPTGQPYSPQRYNGQRPTLNASSQNFELSKGLGDLGLPNTMVFFGINNTFTSYYPNGPTAIWIRQLGVYQKLFGGKVTIKAGLSPNIYEYVGLFTAGSPINAAGTGGLLPVQAGLNAEPSATPLINVTVYGKHGTYVRAGVQRSVSPLGASDEVEKRNGLGIKFSFKDAGPLYIGEVGVRRPSTPNGKQIWLRAGGFYNDSNYRRFDGRGTSSNASLYALADAQITQPDESQPSRGLYLGGSAIWIPQAVNVNTRSFEGRIYAIGPFKKRPRDVASFRVTSNAFSKDARDEQLRLGNFASKNQINASASYSANISPGLFVTPGVTYIHNPALVGDFKDAVVLSLSTFVFL